MSISDKKKQGQAQPQAEQQVDGIEAPKTPKAKATDKTTANKQVVKQGEEIIAKMAEEERELLGSKSGTLHFDKLLGLASRKSLRKVSNDTNESVSTPVAIRLVSDEDIKVPVIDVTKDSKTGIDYQTDVEWKEVKAGEKFVLSYYEFMYLIIQPQYSGRFEANGSPTGAYFSPKLPAYSQGSAKLPTPTINFVTGSIKADIEDIDFKNNEDRFEIKPEYAERFGALMKKRAASRATGAKNKVATPTAVSAALRDLLKTN